MSNRKWVVNASPVILLGDIGQLQLLEALCETLVVPEAVANEIYAGPRKDAAQHWLEGTGASHISSQVDIDPIIAGWDLGAGESAVLSWARRHPGYEAIVDDRAARDCAVTLRISVRGTLGVILLARRQGLVAKVHPLFDALVEAGLHIAPQILHAALRLAGEA